MTKADQTVICAASRTPMGAFQGAFSGVSATDLGAVAIRGALEQSRISNDAVDEVLMGAFLERIGVSPA